MMMQLGDIVFEGLFSPGSFQETRRWNWAEHTVLDTQPHMQKQGTGLQEIELSLKLSAGFGYDPSENLAALYEHAGRSTALPLILGTGDVLGEFVILEIRTTWKRTDSRGTLLAAEVSVRLKEYR